MGILYAVIFSIGISQISQAHAGDLNDYKIRDTSPYGSQIFVSDEVLGQSDVYFQGGQIVLEGLLNKNEPYCYSMGNVLKEMNFINFVEIENLWEPNHYLQQVNFSTSGAPGPLKPGQIPLPNIYCVGRFSAPTDGPWLTYKGIVQTIGLSFKFKPVPFPISNNPNDTKPKMPTILDLISTQTKIKINQDLRFNSSYLSHYFQDGVLSRDFDTVDTVRPYTSFVCTSCGEPFTLAKESILSIVRMHWHCEIGSPYTRGRVLVCETPNLGLKNPSLDHAFSYYVKDSGTTIADDDDYYLVLPPVIDRIKELSNGLLEIQ